MNFTVLFCWQKLTMAGATCSSSAVLYFCDATAENVSVKQLINNVVHTSRLHRLAVAVSQAHLA